MAEAVPILPASTANVDTALKEIADAVRLHRAAGRAPESVMDLRWRFDQVSAKMNQAIYNNQQGLIHDSTLQTIVVLFEILARS